VQERGEYVDQGLLILEVFQTKPADVGNEIVTINYVLHATIVNQMAVNHILETGFPETLRIWRKKYK